MEISYTATQFLEIIENYNLILFPFQIIILIAGITATVLLHFNFRFKNEVISVFLALLWFWTGKVYYMMLFYEVNEIAIMFGVLCAIQGFLILINGFINYKLIYFYRSKLKIYVAYLFILFSLFVYPISSYYSNGMIERVMTLGLPEPTILFTFAMFIFTGDKFPKYLLFMPTLGAFFGLYNAYNLNITQDYILIIAALIAGGFIFFRKKKRSHYEKSIQFE